MRWSTASVIPIYDSLEDKGAVQAAPFLSLTKQGKHDTIRKNRKRCEIYVCNYGID